MQEELSFDGYSDFGLGSEEGGDKNGKSKAKAVKMEAKSMAEVLLETVAARGDNIKL